MERLGTMKRQFISILVYVLLFFHLFSPFANVMADNDSQPVETQKYYEVEIVDDIAVDTENGKAFTLFKNSKWAVQSSNDVYQLVNSDFQLSQGGFRILRELSLEEIRNYSLPKAAEKTISILDDDVPVFNDPELTNQVGTLHENISVKLLEETEYYFEIVLGNQRLYIPRQKVSKNNSSEKHTDLDVEKSKETAKTSQSTTLSSNSEASVNPAEKFAAIFKPGDKYFEVLQPDVTVYDNRSGKLIPVGWVEKGQVYPVGRIVGNWIEIQFGDFKGYIWKNATRPTSKVPAKLGNPGMMKNVKMTAIQDLPVFDNSTGKLIQIGTIKKDVIYPVIRKTGRWMEILFSGRIGYVYETGYRLPFSSNDKYFQVMQPNVTIYDNSTGKLVPIGRIENGQVYPIGKIVGNWIEIQFGNRKGYIWKNATSPTSKVPPKIGNKNLLNKMKVTAIQDLPVYDNSTGNLIRIGTIGKGVQFPIIKKTGNWLEILFAGRIAYAFFTGVEVQSWDGIKYFEALQNDVPVYSKGKEKVLGYLKYGQAYERTGDIGNWHEVRTGKQTGYVWKKATKPLLSSSYKNGFNQKAESENWVEVTSKLTVYDNSSGELMPFAVLEKGVRAPFYDKMGNWYKISVFGRMGWVYTTAVNAHYYNIVNPFQTYTYEQMQKDIEKLANTYPDLIRAEVIGKSVDGRNIYALKMGKGNVEIFFNAAHHAREHITTNLLMEMIDTYAQAYMKGIAVDGYSARPILDRTSIWFVPMVNPDGVTLVQKGHKSAKNPQYVLKLNGYSTDFRAWKANIRGVDLNRQYPADWENIKFNPGKPGPLNYKGPKPLSEPEAKAIFDFTNRHNFKTAVSYHSSGEILYWNFHQDSYRYNRDLAIARMIQGKTGYRLVFPGPNPSGGGYTDWFILAHKKPGFTPEVSPYVKEMPVPIGNFPRIWNQNKTIGLMLAYEAYINRNTR